DFNGVANEVNLLNSLRKLPIWFAEDDIDANLIGPKAYYSIVKGATGVAFFTWDNFKADPAKFAAANQTLKELGQLKDAIFGDDLSTSVLAPGTLNYQVRYANNSLYIISVNIDPTVLPAKFQVPGLIAGTQVQVMFENRTITASDGFFTDSFVGI